MENLPVQCNPMELIEKEPQQFMIKVKIIMHLLKSILIKTGFLWLSYYVIPVKYVTFFWVIDGFLAIISLFQK